MKKLYQHSQGFAAIEAILVLVIVAMIAGTGYFVWQAKRNTDTTLNNSAKSQLATQTKSKSASATKYLPVTNFGIKIPLPADLVSDVKFNTTAGTKAKPAAVGQTTDANPGQIELYSENIHKLCGTAQDFETLFTVNRDDSESAVATPAVASVKAAGHTYAVIPGFTPDNNGCKTDAAKAVFRSTYQALLNGLKNAVAE